MIPSRWMPRGVRLEPEREPSLRGAIVTRPAPEGMPAPKMFAPLRKKPSASKILGAAKAADIVDGLDGEPLGRKLTRFANRGICVLAAVCFDDDPFTTGAQALLRENAAQVLSGLKLAALACGASERKIAAAGRAEIRRMRDACPGAGFWAAGERYPAFELLRYRHGAEKAGYVGAQACVALAEAVEKGRAQCETVVTVAGGGTGHWLNCRVRLGTPVGSVLQAGRPDEETSVVVVESSVNGRVVTDLSEPVTVRTRCILAFRKAPGRRVLPCIGCGRCARACPRGIVPWAVLRQLESGAPDPVCLPGVERCIRCGACAAACPSQIGLTAVVIRAGILKKDGAVP